MRLAQAHDELVGALEQLRDELPELQVYGYRNPSPTPPSLDVFPAATFQEGAGFGLADKQVFYVIRARAAMNDPEAGQKILLRLLDPDDPASVEAAAAAVNATVGANQTVTGFQDDVDGMVSVQWEVGMFI